MCCCWHWCMHRTDPLWMRGRGSEWGREGRKWKTRVWKACFKILLSSFQENSAAGSKEICSTKIFFKPLSKAIVYSSLVQKGAVCQWWLSWVKQVRPGMLQVSLFWSLFRNLRSFFLRFCSFCSHWVFCFDGTLIRTKYIPQLAWVKDSTLILSNKSVACFTWVSAFVLHWAAKSPYSWWGNWKETSWLSHVMDLCIGADLALLNSLTWECHTDIPLDALFSGDLWPHVGSWFWSARFQSEKKVAQISLDSVGFKQSVICIKYNKKWNSTSCSMCNLWSFHAWRDLYRPPSHLTVSFIRMEHLEGTKTI